MLTPLAGQLSPLGAARGRSRVRSAYSVSYLGATDRYIDATVGGTISTNTASVTCWIKLSSLVTYAGIAENRKGGQSIGLLLSGAAGNPLTYFWEGGADEYAAATGLAISLDAWHFVALTVSPTKAIVYLDGASWEYSKTHNAKSLDDVWRLGNDSAVGSRNLDGRQDDVRIYSRALSVDEIADLYAGYEIDATGLIGWWRLDEGSGTNAADSSGNGNDGTLTNGPTWSSDVPAALQ